MSEMYTAILRNAVGKNTPNCMLQDQEMVWVPIRVEHIVLLKLTRLSIVIVKSCFSSQGPLIVAFLLLSHVFE